MKNKVFIIPLLSFFAIIIFGYMSYNNNQKSNYNEAKQLFDLSSKKYFNAYQEKTNSYLSKGQAVKSLFDSSVFVTREEFRVFAQVFLKNNQGIQALNWVIEVNEQQRSTFEHSVREEGFTDFSIHQGYINNKSIPSSLKVSYFPIQYTEPFNTNKKALGFDVTSNLSTLKTLERATSTQKFSASEPTILVQEIGDQKGIVFFLPVFKHQSLLGFVQVVLQMDNVLREIKQIFDLGQNLLVRISDVSNLKGKHQVITSDAIPSSIMNEKLFYKEISLNIGGRQWRLEFYPSIAFMKYYTDKNKVVSVQLLCGVGIGLILTFFLYIIAKQSERVKKDNNLIKSTQKELLFLKETMDRHSIISITDINGNITYINDKFIEISQYSYDELIGQNHRLLKSDVHPKSFYKDLWDTISNGKTWHGQIHNLAKDGSSYWVESTISPLLDKQGKPEQYFSIRTDITQVKLSNSRFDMAVEATGDGIWDWNIITGKFVVSPLYRAMLGFELRELETHIDEWEKSIHPGDAERIKKTLNDYFEHKTDSYKVELRLKCKDGSWKWILCRGTILTYDNAGQPLTMIGIHSDITQRKEMELELLKERNEATKANEAKSEFLSSMSHELRTPLNAILGFGQLLEMDIDNSLSQGQKQSINYILSSGNHLLNLINDVLELSSIEAGEVDISTESVLLTDVIDDTLSLLSPIISKSDIKLSVLPNTKLRVNADYRKLKQVLINLISNAIKYNKPNGSITVEWAQTEHQTVKIMITDTGIGIAKDKHDKVFSAFNRLGQETSVIEGTGIGLMVTRDLIYLMKGDIGFKSTEGQGTSFWVELPLTSETDIIETENSLNEVLNIVDETKIVKVQEVSKKALYVEDNPANRRLMESFFNQQPFQLEMVETGELGWETAMAHNFDLILMDINLPGIGGRELARQLRETERYKNKPIFAVTAAAMKHDIESAKGLFDYYLTKPLDLSELAQVLKKYL